MKLITLLTIAMLSACAGPKTYPPANSLDELLTQTTDKCHLPRSALKLVGSTEVHFQPPADARYDDVDCALAKLKKSRLPMNLGFIGNEAVIDENKQ